jgi:hypothetical protein
VLSIDDASQRERAAAAAFGRLSRDLKRTITDRTRREVVPMAVAAATRHADTPVMRTIAASGRLSMWRGIPGVAFGGTRSVTSTGVPGRVLVRGLEYGAAGQWERLYDRRTPSGRTIRTARRTTRQFMPDRSANPSTVTPAMLDIADDVIAVWVEHVEDAVVAAFNGER